MVDSTSCEILPGRHGSRVATAVGNFICCRCLIKAVTRLGASTGKMPSLATIEALPIIGVLHGPLSSLLSLHILTSRISRLESIGALDDLMLWGLIALHGGLGPQLELGPLLLRY
jgi:hypothetical protein